MNARDPHDLKTWGDYSLLFQKYHWKRTWFLVRMRIPCELVAVALAILTTCEL